jgi:hypothetical protein
VTKSTHKPGRQREWEPRLFPGAYHPPETIWRNILNSDSLRLTASAHSTLRKNKQVIFYHFKLGQEMTNLQLLQLDHLLTSPYFIRSRHAIDLMGEQDAIMLQLHGNNLKQYLDNLKLTV